MGRGPDQKTLVAQLQGGTEIGGVRAQKRDFDFKLPGRPAKALEQRDASSDTGEQNCRVIYDFRLSIFDCLLSLNKHRSALIFILSGK